MDADSEKMEKTKVGADIAKSERTKAKRLLTMAITSMDKAINRSTVGQKWVVDIISKRKEDLLV